MYGMGISSCASGRFSQVRRVDEPGTSHVEYRYTHNRSTRRGGQVEHGSAAPIQPHPLSCESIGTDNKSIEAPSIEEAAAVPNSNTWTTSKG